jgi:hypothetical protein
MSTDPTKSIAGTAGIAAGWSSRIASGATESQKARSQSANQTIEDLLETTDRDPDGTQGKRPTSRPDHPPAGKGNGSSDKPTGSLLDWKG